MKRQTCARQAKTQAPAGEDEGPTAHPLLSAVLYCCGDLRLDQATICRLLCTSKTAAAAVAESCSGQLSVNLDPPPSRKSTDPYLLVARRTSQAAWLKPNGRLLRELQCTYTADRVYPPNTLQAKPALHELLPALPRCTPHLAKLVGSINLGAFSSAAAPWAVADSLGRLTSLTSLQLAIHRAESSSGLAPFLSALQSLPSLAECHLGFVGTGPGFLGPVAAGLQHLPTQLTSLGLGLRLGLHSNSLEEFINQHGIRGLESVLCEGGGELRALDATFDSRNPGIDTSPLFGPLYPKQVPPMLLGHLTALKELRPIDDSLPASWHWDAQLDIRTGDVLPPNLTHLELDADKRDLGGLLVGPLAAPTVSPILPLKQLQVLTIRHSTASADQLQQLPAALTALTAVSLSYDSLQTAAAAAAAWSSLPLVALAVDRESAGYLQQEEGALPDPVGAVLGAVAGLSELTQLVLSGGYWDATQQQLAAALAGLTNLRELELAGSIKPDEPPPQPQPPSREQQGKEAATTAAAEEDAAAAGASPVALSSAIAALPSLRHLSIESNAHRPHTWTRPAELAPIVEGSAAVAALAAGANAQQLTFLQLSGLSDADVGLLAGLLTGLQVWDLDACQGVTAASLPALEGLAGTGVLREVRRIGSGLTPEAAAAAGTSERLRVW